MNGNEILTRPPVAYLDQTFLESDDARPLRILSEYLKPLANFRETRITDSIAMFGSARIQDNAGPMARYYQEARELARLLTEWGNGMANGCRRFVVCTGGGPGIMEAANRGAADAHGPSIGLNIGLPFEQTPNPYITPELSFEFHYFFMRKFWFAYLAKALVVFPGGFGTMDELFEILTLAQTRKLENRILLVLYGSEFWNEVFNFGALAKYGLVSPEDLALFSFADSPQQAFTTLRDGLTRLYLDAPAAAPTPDIARSRI
jgi:uncharacterized protein (TIGR00730 family)